MIYKVIYEDIWDRKEYLGRIVKKTYVFGILISSVTTKTYDYMENHTERHVL